MQIEGATIVVTGASSGIGAALAVMLAERGLAGIEMLDLVAFEDVLERLDFEAEVVGGAEQHEDFVGPVAVAMDLEIALEYVGQRFQPQVAPRFHRRYGAGILDVGLQRFLVGVPLALIALRLAWQRMCADPRLAQNTRKSPFHAASSSNVTAVIPITPNHDLHPFLFRSYLLRCQSKPLSKPATEE